MSPRIYEMGIYCRLLISPSLFSCPWICSDPQDNVIFAKFLYSNDDFTGALYNALTDEGVMIMQLGQSPSHDNVPDEMSKFHMRASLEHDLIRFGFESLHQYEEVRCYSLRNWAA
jgi:hypothetical protein